MGGNSGFWNGFLNRGQPGFYGSLRINVPAVEWGQGRQPPHAGRVRSPIASDTFPSKHSFKTSLSSGARTANLPPSFETLMAVKIRMKRVGAKNAPYFRIVVADSRSPRDGKFIEEIGSYQPLKKGDNFILKLDRAQYWVSKGAQPSDTVASFIKKAGKAAPAAA
jgi:small subunit ribosomal protein S16